MSLVQTIARTISRNSPAILTTAGVVGVLVTAIMAGRATTAAAVRLEEEGRSEEDTAAKQFIEDLKLTWDLYIPAVLMGTSTIACIIGAHSVNTRRQAALMSVYTLTETALKEYKEKVVEQFGANKERKVREAIVQDHIEKDPVTSREVLLTGKGEMLCYESMTGRYFTNDMETLRKAQNDINATILNNFGYVSVNEFYSLIGLEWTTLGDQLGWTTDRLLEIEFTTMLSNDNRPCCVINYVNNPITNYTKVY